MSKLFKPLAELAIPKGLQTGPFGSQLRAEEYTEQGVPVVMPKDIYAGLIRDDSIARTSQEKANALKKHLLQEGDILFPRRGNLGRIGVAQRKNVGWMCGTGCLRVRLKADVSVKYIHQYVQLPQVERWLERNALGQTMLNLNTEIIGELPIYMPSKKDQEKIAHILSTWDMVIERTERLIAAKERRFRWVVLWLINKAGHHEREVSDVIIEVSTRNRDNAIERVLSVTNHSGFILPEDQFERRVASANLSNYKIVNRGEYAYNPSRINVGSIARLDDWKIGALSPMYNVFKLDETKTASDYFLHWLSSYEAKQRIKNSAQGSVRETVNFGDFGAIPIPLPSMEKQRKIARKLNAIKHEITLLRQLAKKYRTQKRGLMQKLVTGEWRIKR